MNYIIFAILLLLIPATLFIKRGMRGPTHTIESISRAIRDLLKRGFDCGFLIISISGTKNFIQLRKYITSSGNFGIKLFFPNANWSADYYEKLKTKCINEKMKYSIVKKEQDNELEFIKVDFKKDSNNAHEFVKEVILEIFEVSDTVKLYVKLENATTEDILIDR